MIDMQALKEYTKEMQLLYVEDDPMIQEEINDFLTRFFPVVDLADNGEMGLEFYKKGVYDIVITDINMPKMNGIEMAQAILDKNPKQSIIVISAHNESAHLLELINMGIQHYALKPINMQQLIKVIYRSAATIHNQKVALTYQEKIEQHNEELEKKVQERTKALKKRLYTDSLTGVNTLCSLMYNLRKYKLEGINFAVVLLIDIDRFQYINDLYGTEFGNLVLIDFAAFLQAFARERSYEIYRTSGDVFVLLDKVHYIDTEKYEEDLATLQKQIKVLKIHIRELDEEVDIDATIGMSLGQEHPLEHADIALQHAKEHKKTFAVYNMTIDTREKMKENIAWKHKIDEAIDHDRAVPVFQPIVDSAGTILKYETLMRLAVTEDGKKKLITPVHFFETAVKTKQYAVLSKMVINKALERLAHCHHTISINLSYEDVNNKLLQQELLEKIKKDSTGERLIIEITESENIQNYKLLKEIIGKFRRLGVRIAIDDFGSGFSNFEHVLEIHPDYIKIDGTLIKNIDTDPHALILAKAITHFSHELGIRVIAEYVHSKEVFEILQEFGVDEFQGFYFYEPLPEMISKT